MTLVFHLMKKETSGALQTVSRACEVLRAFRNETELLRLMDVASRVALDNATTLRILRTLSTKGLVERIGRYEYRSRIRFVCQKQTRIGYAAQSTEFSFSREVTDSVRQAAVREEIILVEVDNRYSRKAAIRNASLLIKEGVDLVMEFQTDEQIAPVISSMYQQAGIPVIAIEIPHPGATFFGANNFTAGVMGGRHLGRWVQENWKGQFEEVLLLELPRAGPLPASRLTGILDGLRETIGPVPAAKIKRLNGNGQFSRSMEIVRRHIRMCAPRRALIGAINDPSAIGALRAFEEAGRSEYCAVIGQNASVEARLEMRRPGSRLVRSVGYFPERYGDVLMEMALNLLEKKHVPPAVFVEHKLVTAENLHRFYPNDSFISPSEMDSLMLRRAAHS